VFSGVAPSSMLWHGFLASSRRVLLSAGALCFVIAPARHLRAQLPRLHPPSAVPPSSGVTNVPEQGSNNSVLPAASPKEQPIPLPQIAQRTEDLDRLLRELARQLNTKYELEDAERNVAFQANEIRERARQTQELLAGTPTPLELEAELRFWASRDARLYGQRKHLTSLAAKLEDQIQTLAAQRAVWQSTMEQIHNDSGLESVVSRIRGELDSISALRSEALEQLNFVVNLQDHSSQQDQEIADLLALLREARQQGRTRLLKPDGPPLWTVVKLPNRSHLERGVILESVRRSLRDVESQKSLGLLVLPLYAFVLFGIYRLRRSIYRSPSADIPADSLRILNRPLSVALLVALLTIGESLESAPMGITFLLHALCIIPLVRLLVPIASLEMKRLIYVISTAYVCEGLHLLVQLPLPLRREVSAAEALAASAAFAWLASIFALKADRVYKTTAILVRTGLLFLLASFAANVFGFVSLAQVLRFAVVGGLFNGVILFCGARILSLILSGILRQAATRSLLGLRIEPLERWGRRVLGAGAALVWCRSMLRLFTVYESVVGTISGVLRRPIGIERIQFTLGEALGLVTILVGGYALANTLTFILKNVLLPKLPLKRGLPYAISTTTYYVLLLLVAAVALSATGVELNKFTVLTGALGVGLGFGLQNIVNNFVSGLILLFERPIHVGDTVDVGGLVGIVRRIGARSSTVVTFQGAEVIVPNSNLLSNQVINWTLSSPWRRVDVPVRVAYGTDPESIIKLLVGVAQSCPGVLLERPPAAFFLGFGESALNFELRFWSARQDTWLDLQSNVTVAVAKALQEAGVEIPFPQRDLHFRSVSTAAAENLSNNPPRTTLVPNSTERRVRA
jgi:potassium-dependent mechanosensitive channel